jgi:hypothetical protein
VSNECGFEEADEVGFVGGGFEQGRELVVGEDSGAGYGRVGGVPFVDNDKAGRHVSAWRRVVV